MSKHIFIFILLVVSMLNIHAQTLVKGTITNKEDKTLSGVTILLHQSQSGAISQSDGSYEINVPAKLKVITLEFSYVGYRTQAQTINLTKHTSAKYTLDIQLMESQLELQEITITAGFIKKKDDVPYPIETVKNKDIITSGEVNLTRSLAQTPGVYFSNFGLGGGQTVIRGLSRNNLVTLNNGIKQEVFQFSANHPFLIDEYTASHIEIIKGPVSLQYGSDAVGGVVNVVRERSSKPNSIEGDVVSQYHSNTNGYLNSLGVKTGFEKFYFGVRGSLKSHKDYEDGDENVVNNTRLNESNISVNTGVRLNEGLFTLNYNYTDAEYGIQNTPQINLFSSPLASTLLIEDRKNEVWYQDLENHLLTSNNTLYLGKNSLNLDLGWQSNTRELIGGGINGQNQLVQPQLVSTKLNTFTYNVKFNMPTGKHNFIIGANGANSKNEADENKPNVPMPDAEINDIGLYVIGDFQLSENLALTSGLRFDHRAMESFPVATNNTDRFKVDNSYNSVNGSLGMTYNLTENQFLKANIARGFRSPNVPELTQNGIHGGRFERGDTNLDTQSNFQFDVTYHLHTNWATFNISPFYNTVNNFIYLVQTNEDAPIGGGKIFQHVQNDANFWGGEIALDVHPAIWLGIHGSYSIIRADITDNNEGIDHPTFTPQDRLTAEIKLQQQQIGFLKQPYLTVGMSNFMEQNQTGQNEAVTPSYTLLNTKIGASVLFGKQKLDLFITGNNLGNETYIDHLSITKPLGLNMMGRNVMFGVRFPFSFNTKSSI